MSHDSRGIASPVIGYYRIRFVRGGFAVPAWLDFDNVRWIVNIGGGTLSRTFTPEDVELIMFKWLIAADLDACEQQLARLLAFGEVIPEAEYQRLMDLREWASSCSEHHPCLNPTERIDLTRMPSLW